MTPYIEYKGQKYEFEANFTLKREFDKEIQARYKQMLNNKEITEQDIEKINEIREFVKENPNIDAKALEQNEEMKNKMLEYAPLMDTLILSDIYEKYCFKMLQIKYGIDKQLWESMLEQYVDDYCDDYSGLDNLFNKVIEKVFTRKVEEKKKKPLPEWM